MNVGRGRPPNRYVHKQTIEQERSEPFVHSAAREKDNIWEALSFRLRHVATLQVRRAKLARLNVVIDAGDRLRQRLLRLHHQPDRKLDQRDRELDAAVLKDMGSALGLALGPPADARSVAQEAEVKSAVGPGIQKLIGRVPGVQCYPGTNIPFG
eukprot:598997-Pyramimonas_sp.AAC.1